MTARSYRLAPQDRTGIWLGLTAVQLAVALGGIVGGIVLLNAGLRPVFGIAVMGLAVGLAVVPWNGRPLVEALPDIARAARTVVRPSRARWFAPLDATELTLPGVLAATRILAVDRHVFGQATHREKAAVVHDRRTGISTATLRVEGRQFTLASADDQQRMLALWGDALAPFSRERSPIAWVRWSEWAAPAGIEAQQAWFADHAAVGPDDPARRSYEALLAEAGPVATRHEILLTVAVDGRRCPARKGRNRTDAAIETLGAEVRLFAGRLQGAGLTVSGPLSPRQLTRAVAVRVDPARIARLDATGRTLGEAAGLAGPLAMGPLAVDTRPKTWQADDTHHRAYWVSEWPRGDVGPEWLAQLMLFAGPVRTVSVFLQPVAPSSSRRAIERQAAKLDSDADQRSRTGFRVGAAHRRQREAVEEREAELVAGFAEQAYAGVVDVCGATPELLDEAAAEICQAAAACGIELRPLHWRHDQGVAAGLPLAYGITAGRVA
jgi:hypothetical protein